MLKILSKLPSVLIAGLIMCLAASCGGSSDNTPQAVAQSYVQALAKGDSDALMKVMDTEGASETDLKKIGGKMQILVAEVEAEIQKKGGLDKVECDEPDIEDNRAALHVIIHYKDGSSDRQMMRLVKNKDGEWKVRM